jgi:mono/diheme cytochrome c family protein
MGRIIRVLLVAVFAIFVVGGLLLLVRLKRYGLSAHDEPTKVEAIVARAVRNWAVPADLRDEKNPLPATPELLDEARAHFADHCASCHGNDGKGQTTLGRHFYPHAPDMTLEATQSLSDGQLFAIIENGVRLTGMPGWGEGTAESARGSWSLVQFIRHLPKVSEEEVQEMEKMNPMTAEKFEQMKEEESFLQGDAESPESKPSKHPSAHSH